MDINKPKIVVTGAAGFLGGRLAKHLASLNEYEVLATSRRTDRALELQNAGCTFVAGDLCDTVFCQRLLQDAVYVVHCAALSSPWGIYEDFYRSNVQTTHNLIQSAITQHVKRLVFISTPSIYVNYTDRYDVREDDPLPLKMVNAYAATKLIAEQYVLAHNSASLQTVSLRPRAIIGAEDTIIFPRLIRAYAEGKLKIIGNGQNVCDLTSVRNVIQAVMCAVKADAAAMGEAYNIDGNPVQLWPTINKVLQTLGHQPVSKKVPQLLAMSFAGILEFFARVSAAKKEPALTRYGIGVLAQSLTMNISKARTKLDYIPIQTTEEGIHEFIEWYTKTT